MSPSVFIFTQYFKLVYRVKVRIDTISQKIAEDGNNNAKSFLAPILLQSWRNLNPQVIQLYPNLIPT